MTEEDLRALLRQDPSVVIQIAKAGDGSPALAWGDTFFFTRTADGAVRKMPFATIVTRDYPGFDEASALCRGGLFRLNVEVDRDTFESLFGFPPNALDAHREELDFQAVGSFFPHPVYGAQGWVSILNPGGDVADRIQALLMAGRDRSLKRGT